MLYAWYGHKWTINCIAYLQHESVMNIFQCHVYKVCEEKGLSCDEDLLQTLSDCQQLRSFFDCDSCLHSQGPDQPAYVDMQAPSASLPGKCLMNTGASTCAASHTHTIRLCACSELLWFQGYLYPLLYIFILVSMVLLRKKIIDLKLNF